MKKSQVESPSAEKPMPRRRIADFKKTNPSQLSLFQTLTPASKGQLIELFDLMPKYVSRITYPDNTFRLPKLERTFSFQGKVFHLVIRPGNIDCSDGVSRDRYPTERDELVLAVLMKLASDPNSGCYLDDKASVIFSYNQVQEELKRLGRMLAQDEIKEALETLKRTSLEVSDPEGARIETNLIHDIGHSVKQNGSRRECFVQFNKFVNEAIERGGYRLYDYETVLRYKSILATRLHRRLALTYTNASITTPYNIFLDNLLNECGINPLNRFSKNKAMLVEALEEMKDAEVVLVYRFEEVKAKGQGKRLKVFITPSRTFVNEMKRSNWTASEAKNQLGQQSE